jgi:hypothetical protein
MQSSGIDSLGPQDSVEDLLLRIRTDLNKDSSLSKPQVIQRLGDLGWTANLIARCLDKPRSRIRLIELIESEARFEAQLNQVHGYSQHGQARLRSQRRNLIRHAQRFGLRHDSFCIREQWAEIAAAVKFTPGGCAIVKAAIRLRLRPCEFSDADLVAWSRARTAKGRTFVYVRMAEAAFRAAIRGAGLEKRLPHLNCSRRTRPQYRMKLEDLPRKLREEIEEVLECVAKGRHRRSKMFR